MAKQSPNTNKESASSGWFDTGEQHSYSTQPSSQDNKLKIDLPVCLNALVSLGTSPTQLGPFKLASEAQYQLGITRLLGTRRRTSTETDQTINPVSTACNVNPCDGIIRL